MTKISLGQGTFTGENGIIKIYKTKFVAIYDTEEFRVLFILKHFNPGFRIRKIGYIFKTCCNGCNFDAHQIHINFYTYQYCSLLSIFKIWCASKFKNMHPRKKSVRARMEIRAFTDQYPNGSGFNPCLQFFRSGVERIIFDDQQTKKLRITNLTNLNLCVLCG
jgi:hypothetical protein